ncbi:predicted protein [Sclerotinia sclerotiorum 1980 UF-70]|uniref:Uncharacterized protein n=1 Tax=Sclerotinia sclerotiorum (strain ATCC 18683 / 1980 / Ss-1) TaxID=665079 RepID=A7ERQ7_SCLS1|nr:predicted protein [Sclerotinia sclerotiorum 1980 UF-70]EDN92149.1 predicted protein [Sclerotinia sclerotiorum 1980 UF-70]
MSTLHPDIVEFNRRPLPDLDECMVRPYSVSQGALGLQDRFNTVDTAYASRAGEETADKRNSEKVSLQHNVIDIARPLQAPYIGEDARVTQLRSEFLNRSARENIDFKEIDQILRQMPANPTPERLPLEVLQFLPHWSQFRHKVLQFRVQCLEKNLTDEQKGPGSDFQWIMDWERKQNEGM